MRAPGVVVPIEIRWIAATVEGRIERKALEAGEKVHPETLILQMSSPTLSRNLDTARIELEAQEAQSHVLQRQLISDSLAQEALLADFEMRYENARVRMEANHVAHDAVPALDVRESEIATETLSKRVDIEKTRLERLRELNDARLRADRAALAGARRQLRLQQELVDALSVRAGIEGTLQDLPIEAGQQISVGHRLARVAGDGRYKIELRVQEQQAKEIQVGQAARISAGGQQVRGKVSRVDPAVQAGTVVVDVLFADTVLPGARPDLRVQGLIETGFVADALVVQRPVSAEENSKAEVFVVDAEGHVAQRRPVQLGLASTDRIQVTDGLREGERVIVSDVSRFAGQPQIILAE